MFHLFLFQKDGSAFVLDADGERIFSFVRVQTGDELSRRSKFALVIWCGSDVSVLKRARVSTDKILVKDIIQVRYYLEILNSKYLRCTCI